ncbi:MAG: hypothetical protein AAF253_04620 [Pseudomonadota bacterium]
MSAKLSHQHPPLSNLGPEHHAWKHTNYKHYLIRFLEACLHRNTDAHYKVSERMNSTAVKYGVISALSAISILALSLSDDLRNFFVHLRVFGVGISYDFVIIILAILFVCFGVGFQMLRYTSRFYDHKNAASSFSELRRELLFLHGLKEVPDGRLYMIIEKYNLIVENSPMVDRKIWDAVESDKHKQIDDLLACLLESTVE